MAIVRDGTYRTTMITPRPDLLELLAEMDDAVDSFAWHVLLTGGRVDSRTVRHFRTQARLEFLNELAIQRSLEPSAPVENRAARRKPARVRPSVEPPH